MSADRIEKRAMLEAPLERVWRLVSDAREFGSWLGVAFDGRFAAGKALTGKISCAWSRNISPCPNLDKTSPKL